MRALSALSGTGVHEVQLRDLLRALDAARTDDRIERVLLRVDGMGFSGYASIREVAAAIAELRAAGKQVVSFGENFTQMQYLLAAQADEVYLDPMGGLMLEGLGRYHQYYREGLQDRSEEHTSELQSLMRISYAVFCLKKKTTPVTSAQTIYYYKH